MENYIKVIKLQENRVKYGNGKLWQKQGHPCLKKQNRWKKINSRLKKQNGWIQKKNCHVYTNKKIKKGGDET